MVIRIGMVAALVVACGTTAGEGVGDRNLPSAGLGPWRPLDVDEVRSPPFVTPARSATGGPWIVAIGDGTFALYRGDADGSIVREVSSDGIEFVGPERVLLPEAPWEGRFTRDPCVVRSGDRWLLYYGAAGGIGLAESSDGLSFVRLGDGPILRPEAPWEGERIGAPSVLPEPGGGFSLYYGAAGGIGLASSPDGVSWTREGSVPVLEPGVPGSWDDRFVGHPAARSHVSPTGRRSVQLFYVGVGAAPAEEEPPPAIGVAATFDGRTFSRLAENPVLDLAGNVVPGLGPPVDVGPAYLLPFTETRGSGFGVGGAIWPPEWSFARAE